MFSLSRLWKEESGHQDCLEAGLALWAWPYVDVLHLFDIVEEFLPSQWPCGSQDVILLRIQDHYIVIIKLKKLVFSDGSTNKLNFLLDIIWILIINTNLMFSDCSTIKSVHLLYIIVFGRNFIYTIRWK